MPFCTALPHGIEIVLFCYWSFRICNNFSKDRQRVTPVNTNGIHNMIHREYNTKSMATATTAWRGYKVLLYYYQDYGTASCPALAQCHWLLSLIKSAQFENFKYCLVKAQGHMERDHRYSLAPTPQISPFTVSFFSKLFLLEPISMRSVTVARMSGVTTLFWMIIQEEVIGCGQWHQCCFHWHMSRTKLCSVFSNVLLVI